MGFQRRDVLIGGVASAATATLAFIDLAKAAGDPEVKKLVLGFGIDPPFAIYITAIEKGWFREAGFTDVTVKSSHPAIWRARRSLRVIFSSGHPEICRR